MRLFVFGYFGCGNLGDEAILKGFSDWAGRNLPGSVIVAQSANPDETIRDHGVEAVHKYAFAKILGELRRCDAVVAPGGGLLQDSTSVKSLFYYLFLIRTAAFLRKPVYMLSQGMGPLNGSFSRAASAAVMRRCEHIAVRDEDSLKLLRKLGLPENKIELTGDLVLLAEPARAGDETRAGDRDGRPIKIGISLRPSPELDHIMWVLIGCMLRLNANTPIELRMFSLNCGDDRPIMEKFLELVRQRAPGIKARLVEGAGGKTLTVAEMEAEVTDLDVMAGMRLHSLIFSAKRGIPFVGLSYDPKVSSFTRGCGQHVIEDLANLEPLDLMHGIELALNNREKQVEAIRAGVERMRVTLHHAIDRFRTVLCSKACAKDKLFTIPVSTRTFEETMAYIYNAIEAGDKEHIITVNPEMMLSSRSDAKFREALRHSGLNTADGVGIRIGVRLKYGEKIDKVAGVEIMERLLAESAEKGTRLFLLGAKPDVIKAAVEKIGTMKSPPVVVGFHHGYLKDVAIDKLIEEINQTKPDALLVGMGSPAQEFWIRGNMEKIDAKIFIGVGGSFDVLAGTMRRAPVFMQKTGLEWLYRLIKQPSRITRMAGFPWFLFLAAIEAALYRLHISRD